MSYVTRGNDLARQFVVTPSIVPQSIAATVTGDEVSIVGAEGSVEIEVNIGALADVDGTAYLTFTLTQATATGGSFSAADSDDYDPVAPTGSTTAWDRIIDAAGEASKTYRFNYIPTRTYDFIKVVATETGSITSALISANVRFMSRVQPSTGD